MAIIDRGYHKLLQNIINQGFTYEDLNRKEVNRIQIPSYTFTHDFKDGFPAITTKKLYWKGVVGELIWFLRGDTNIKYLVDNNINIWNKDTYNYYKRFYSGAGEVKLLTFEEWFEERHSFMEVGYLGRIYGAQWRDWTNPYESNSLDQISSLIKELKENPTGTKHIVTAWNPAELNNMALPPCHWSFEVLVEPISFKERVKICLGKYPSYSENEIVFKLNDNVLLCEKYQFTLKWHQRSVDTFLGLPFNIASYALLAQIIGKMTNMIPKSIIGDLSNVHIYEPHLEAVKAQLNRDMNHHSNCELIICDNWIEMVETHLNNELTTMDDVLNETDIKDFRLENYKSYPKIPAEMLSYNK